MGIYLKMLTISSRNIILFGFLSSFTLDKIINGIALVLILLIVAFIILLMIANQRCSFVIDFNVFSMLKYK